MNTPGDAEDRLRVDLATMAERVVARPNALADGAESRAEGLLRRRRRRGALAVAGVVLVAAGSGVPVWLVTQDRAGAPAGQPNDPAADPTARCQTLVDTPSPRYSRVLAATATTAAGLLEWLGRDVPGDPAWDRQTAHPDPRPRFVVCGLVAPHVVVSGDPGAPPYHGPWAVVVILPPTGRPITRNGVGTREGVRAEVSAIPPASAQQRCGALLEAPHSGYTRLLISRGVNGAQLRDWLRTREGGTYSQEVIDRYDPALHYAVCGLVEPDAAPPGPVPPKGPLAVALIVPPAGAPIQDTIGPVGGVRDMIALLR